MTEDVLYIGQRRYSSWSLRGWLAVRMAGLDAPVKMVLIDGTGASPEVQAVSPSKRVPYLVHRGVTVWESLAIGEYCADLVPDLWPKEPQARAYARSISNEMHAGFRDLRGAMPMNLGRVFPRSRHGAGVLADLGRIQEIWSDMLERYHGPYLFGPRFTLADAMFAPVVARFLSYQPDMVPSARRYCDAVRSYPLVAEWYDEAALEPPEWRIAAYETPPA